MNPDPEALWKEQKPWKESFYETILVFKDTLAVLRGAKELGIELPSELVEALDYLKLELALDSMGYSHATSNANSLSIDTLNKTVDN